MKHRYFLALLVALIQAAFAVEVPVVIRGVVDGRTLELRHPNGATSKVRLAGLGAASSEVLARLAPKGARGFVLVGGTSPQSSPVLSFVYLCSSPQPCTAATFNLNAEVLRQGGAKFQANFEDADLRQRLISAQAEAQKARRGVWAR